MMAPRFQQVRVMRQALSNAAQVRRFFESAGIEIHA
jgi:hypothetical protein